MSNLRRLPGPLADVWDWQMNGLCRGRDSAQFFHPDGERGSARTRREMAAKALCRACPVRPECAAQSLAAREPYGVWGGFTEAERLRLLAIGWQDASYRFRRKVDVHKLEAKLSRESSPALAVPMQGSTGRDQAHRDQAHRDQGPLDRAARDRSGLDRVRSSSSCFEAMSSA